MKLRLVCRVSFFTFFREDPIGHRQRYAARRRSLSNRLHWKYTQDGWFLCARACHLTLTCAGHHHQQGDSFGVLVREPNGRGQTIQKVRALLLFTFTLQPALAYYDELFNWESLRELRMWKNNLLFLIKCQVQAVSPSHLSRSK